MDRISSNMRPIKAKHRYIKNIHVSKTKGKKIEQRKTAI